MTFWLGLGIGLGIGIILGAFLIFGLGAWITHIENRSLDRD